MRLDKFISNSTAYSRSQVKRLIKNGAVKINAIDAHSAQQSVNDTDEVFVDGQQIQAPGLRYFMLNKPLGYVSATKDNEHPTVLDLIDEPRKDKLHIAGRLDIDTTGLVLLTDDGQWSHRVTSPRYDCKKVYYALTADPIAPNAVEIFAKGIQLESEKSVLRPAHLEIIYSNEARLSISEGKYHQVKRMFAALGNRVEELHRESIGNVALDPDLELGEYRQLTEAELKSFTSAPQGKDSGDKS